jgi:hypothetical protein
LLKEYDKVYQERKSDVKEFSNDTKTKIVETTDKIKETNAERKAIKEQKKLQSKLEVKATPVIENNEVNLNNISNKLKSNNRNLVPAIFKKENTEIEYPELIEIEINKKKKNNLFGEQNFYQPELRDYNQ